MLSKGSPVNPGFSLLYLCEQYGLGSARTRMNQAFEARGYAPKERNNPQHAGTHDREKTEACVASKREVLRTHSTVEGGEPQGSREGRPRYPLEGRGEQQDVPIW